MSQINLDALEKVYFEYTPVLMNDGQDYARFATYTVMPALIAELREGRELLGFLKNTLSEHISIYAYGPCQVRVISKCHCETCKTTRAWAAIEAAKKWEAEHA